VLADALADLLREPPDDPFTPEVVSVHSRGVERWLSHRLAAHLGTSPGKTTASAPTSISLPRAW